MSPLAMATLEWVETLHQLTGEDPRRLVLPRRAFEMLCVELAREATVPDGDPISGVGRDGRVWLACTEIVSDHSGSDHAAGSGSSSSSG